MLFRTDSEKFAKSESNKICRTYVCSRKRKH